MSETKKEKINVMSIPSTGQVTLTVGGLFYQRLNKLLIDFGDSTDKKTLLKAMYTIKQGRAETDSYAFNIETLIILLRDIEQKFKDTEQAVDQELEVDKLPAEMQELRDQMENMDKA
jgi:hypothetical protein